MSVEVEVSYDLETEDNSQVNTIVMAGNDCCLSSMCCCPRYNHPSGPLVPAIAYNPAWFLFYWHQKTQPLPKKFCLFEASPPHISYRPDIGCLFIPDDEQLGSAYKRELVSACTF